MTVAVTLESGIEIGPDLRWPLRVAALRQCEIVIVQESEEGGEIDLTHRDNDTPDAQLADAIASLLDEYVGKGQWRASSAPEPDEDDVAITVQFKRVRPDRIVEESLAVMRNRAEDLLVYVTLGVRGEDDTWRQRSERMLTSSPCEAVYIVPGKRRDDGKLLVTAARGPHCRAAIELSAELAEQQHRRLTSLYVQPDIGPDAMRVGDRIQSRFLDDALSRDAPEVDRQVQVANRPDAGILRACEDERCEALVMGSTYVSALGARADGIAARVHRGTNEPTIIVTRATIPLVGRARRWLDLRLQRWVPQLGREERTDLVARIQSNSQWNFDFIMLVALSTLIAAMGLLDNSPAVIIGAMLVAPLMTPLLGVGIALSQGNPRLAEMSLKSVAYGFTTAFVLAYLVGLASTDFVQATEEMDARDWPGVLDLVIAFVSGLAAAYASGRPGLLAALPGVAIAAALLPPIATSGLSAAIGDHDLAFGALLLFAVNMVAIILAAALSLWATGLRRVRKPTRTTRLVGTVMIMLLIALTIRLAVAPPRLAAPPELVDAVVASLAEDTRLRRIRLARGAGGPVVQIDLGGGTAPDEVLSAALRDLAKQQLGEEYGVRLTFRHEYLLR